MDQIREIKAVGKRYGVSFVVDEDDYQKFELWKYKWYPHIDGKTIYIRAFLKGRTIVLHRLLLGLLESPKTVFVDHEDRNGLNNRRSNLRIATNSENQRNATKQSPVKRKSISRFKGVSKFSRKNTRKPWRATIMFLGKSKHLGSYSTELEAAKAYNDAASELSNLFLLNDLGFRSDG